MSPMLHGCSLFESIWAITNRRLGALARVHLTVVSNYMAREFEGAGCTIQSIHPPLCSPPPAPNSEPAQSGDFIAFCGRLVEPKGCGKPSKSEALSGRHPDCFHWNRKASGRIGARGIPGHRLAFPSRHTSADVPSESRPLSTLVARTVWNGGSGSSCIGCSCHRLGIRGSFRVVPSFLSSPLRGRRRNGGVIAENSPLSPHRPVGALYHPSGIWKRVAKHLPARHSKALKGVDTSPVTL